MSLRDLENANIIVSLIFVISFCSVKNLLLLYGNEKKTKMGLELQKFDCCSGAREFYFVT